MGTLDRLVGGVLRGISKKPGLYKHGPSPTDLSPLAVADHYGLKANLGPIGPHVPPPSATPPINVSLITPSGNNSAIHFYRTPEEWTEKVADWYIDEGDPRRELVTKVGKHLSDIDALNASGKGGAHEGSKLYRAMCDINRGQDAMNVTGYLSRINRIRRTENMLSNQMRSPESGDMVMLDPYQKLHLGGNPVGIEEYLRMSDIDKLAALAETGKSNIDSVYGGYIDAWPIDFSNPSDVRLQGALSLVHQMTRNNPTVSKTGGAKAGESTLRRAFTTSSIKDALAEGADPDDLVEKIMNSKHPWWDGLFYCEGGSV